MEEINVLGFLRWRGVFNLVSRLFVFIYKIMHNVYHLAHSTHF